MAKKKGQDKQIKGFVPRMQVPKMNRKSSWRGFMIYAVLGILLLSFFVFSSDPSQRFLPTEPLSKVISDVKEDKVSTIEVNGDSLLVDLKDDGEYSSRKEEGQSLFDAFQAAGVDPQKASINIKDRTLSQAWVSILTILLPLGLMLVFFFFIFRQAREGASSVFSFGKSNAKQFTKDMPKATFADVEGVDEAKQELKEIVDFLKHPGKYKAIGARTPKGVLLVGPAGTGKTLLARAVAGEASVPFFSVAGSEFMEMLVGVGAARVRDLFGQAKRSAPAIVFIDEIESIGRMRGMGFSGGHDEREQTLNQILVEMDGFSPNDNVIIIAATNRPELLDPALTRPGRFDRRVLLDLPDIQGRKAIIKIHMKGKPFAKELNVESLAKRTVGFSGADLENMLNEAAILAAREERKEILNIDLEEAATKVKLGPQRKRMQSEEERRMTAYHEGGHALVAHLLPQVDPVHRISIVARASSGGHTEVHPQIDRNIETKSRLLERIAMALGGRAAEDLVFKEFTTGASADLDTASSIARLMVAELGMSDLGPTVFQPRPQAGTLQMMMADQNPVSPELAGKIDKEIAKIIDEGYKKAKDILVKNRKKLDLIADTLLEKETLERDDFEKLVGKPVEPKANGETKFKSAKPRKTAQA
jgi:cell division protease FtsH